MLCENLTLYNIGRIAVSKWRPLAKILLVMHAFPIDWRIAEQNTELTVPRECHVHCAHRSKEFFVDRRVPHCVRHRRVLPNVPKSIIGDFLDVYEPIHQILVSCIATFHDDVVDGGCEPGVANEREPKGVALLVAMIALTEGDNIV